MSEDQNDTFKVTDRRLFNSDGSAREERSEPEPELTPELATVSAVTAGHLAEGAADAENDSEEGGELTEFMAVLMEFATPAFIHLGLAEHPATGRPEVNLPAAQQAIEMLRVLREKTVGNLIPEEDDFFEGLLADLRMRFVSLKK